MIKKIGGFIEYKTDAKPKLSYKQLKALNEVQKKDYMANVLLADKQLQVHIAKNKAILTEITHDVQQLKDDVEDIQDDWEDDMDEINEVLRKKGIENGISKDQYLK